MEFVLFAVNVGNRSRRRGRANVDQLCEEWSRQLTREGRDFVILSLYGHTGNFLLQCGIDVNISDVAEVLMNSLGRRFAVFSKDEFLACVRALDASPLSVSKTTHDRRATPGAVMETNPHGGVPPLPRSNEQVTFTSFAQARVRGVYKNDILNPDGRTLDQTRREGGWGNVANLMKREFGGDWTARSLKTLRGMADHLRYTTR